MLRKLAAITLCASSLALASEAKPAISTTPTRIAAGVSLACFNPVMTCMPTPFMVPLTIGGTVYTVGKYFYYSPNQQIAPKKA